MKRLSFPKHLRAELKSIGKANGFPSGDAFGTHLVERGLRQYEGLEASAPIPEKLESVMESQGYSAVDEVIEHLIEQGLMAYSNEEGLDPEKFEERLRGLGYID